MSAELDIRQASKLFDQAHPQPATSLVWPTGIKSIDVVTRHIVTGGSVIAFAQSPSSDGSAPLSHHIITTFLTTLPTQQPPQPDPSPSVFIITPPSTQTALKIATLLDQRLQTLPNNTRTGSTDLLSHIQLLQYLSVGGLTGNLGDVAASLFETTTTTTTTSSSSNNTDTGGRPRSILLVQGMSTTLSELHRRNGATHAAAIASNLMRSLTHLSRTYAHNLLVLVDLELEVCHPPSAAATAEQLGAKFGGLLASAFSSSQGEMLALSPVETALSAVLEGGMDVIVATHDGFRKTREHDRKEARKGGPSRGRTAIVEVVKDRNGAGFGSWGVWVQQA